MKKLAIFTAWTFVAGVVLYTALSPAAGVIHQNPMAALGLGLIGFGLCKDARKNSPSLALVPVFGRKKTRRETV